MGQGRKEMRIVKQGKLVYFPDSPRNNWAVGGFIFIDHPWRSGTLASGPNARLRFEILKRELVGGIAINWWRHHFLVSTGKACFVLLGTRNF